VVLLAVRWYLRNGLPHRDLDELVAERGIEVDHVTLYRWTVEAVSERRFKAGGHEFVSGCDSKQLAHVHEAVSKEGSAARSGDRLI
jgi:transposase-like protein